MLIAHLGVAAPVTAPDARLHGGPAGGVRERADARLAHERARAAPAPQGAADSMLYNMIYLHLARRALSQEGWGADRGADTRR